MQILRLKFVRVVAVILTVIVLAVIAVQLFLPAEKIKEMALAQARSSLGRKVSAGEVAVSLRGGLGVRIADFTIHNPDGFPGEPLLATRALELKLALGPLLRGEIEVTRLVVEGPRINLRRQADGLANFVFAGAADQKNKSSVDGAAQPKAPPPLEMSDVRLTDGDVFFADLSLETAQFESVQLSGCQIELAVATETDGVLSIVGRFAAQKIAVAGPAETPELSAELGFFLNWNPDNSELTITDTEAVVAGVPFALTGQLNFAKDTPSGLLHVQAQDIACVDLAQFLPPEIAKLVQGDQSSGQLQATISILLAEQTQPAATVTGNVVVRDLDLSLVQPFLPPGQAGQIAGRADLKFEFVQDERLTYSGTAAIRKMSYRDAALVDELQSLDAQMSFTPQEFVVTSSEAKFGAGTFSLSGTLRDPLPYFLPPEMQPDETIPLPHLTFELSTEYLDVDRLVPVASPSTESSADKSSASASKSSPLSGEFPRLTASGVFRAASVVYLQVPLTDVVGKITLADQQLKISEVQGSVYQGAVAGELAVDLSDLNDPAFVGQYDVKNIEINEFASRFANLSGVLFGRFEMKGNFAANGLDPVSVRNSLSLDAGAGLTSGHVVTTGQTYAVLSKLASQAGQSLEAKQSLRDLAARISVSDGRVSVNQLQTQLGQFGDLTVDGYYGFNGDLKYRGGVLLSAAQTNQWFAEGGLLSGLGELMGSRRPQRLLLPLSVGGTRDKPNFQIDFAAVTNDMQQRVIDEQGAKLSDSLAEEAKKKLGGLFDKWK